MPAVSGRTSMSVIISPEPALRRPTIGAVRKITDGLAESNTTSWSAVVTPKRIAGTSRSSSGSRLSRPGRVRGLRVMVSPSEVGDDGCGRPDFQQTGYQKPARKRVECRPDAPEEQ